jgi:hypothetical protein
MRRSATEWVSSLVAESDALQVEFTRILERSPINTADLLADRERLVAHGERVAAFAASVARGLSAANN